MAASQNECIPSDVLITWEVKLESGWPASFTMRKAFTLSLALLLTTNHFQWHLWIHFFHKKTNILVMYFDASLHLEQFFRHGAFQHAYQSPWIHRLRQSLSCHWPEPMRNATGANNSHLQISWNYPNLSDPSQKRRQKKNNHHYKLPCSTDIVAMCRFFEKLSFWPFRARYNSLLPDPTTTMGLYNLNKMPHEHWCQYVWKLAFTYQCTVAVLNFPKDKTEKQAADNNFLLLHVEWRK